MPHRTFVIGDVHGCAATLRRLVETRLVPRSEDRIFLLGDLIDRGPDSKGVLDFIFELRERGIGITSIRGNHEEMLLRADDPHVYGMWAANGGMATLASFQADGPGDIPPHYRALLASLPLHIQLDGFILVHAGLNFGRPDPFDDTHAMLWSRDGFVDTRRLGGRRLICGHTPVTRRQIEASLSGSKIMLDNGCSFGGLPETGSLAALELSTMIVTYQEYCG